jgi:hypothetical protein
MIRPPVSCCPQSCSESQQPTGGRRAHADAGKYLRLLLDDKYAYLSYDLHWLTSGDTIMTWNDSGLAA